MMAILQDRPVVDSVAALTRALDDADRIAFDLDGTLYDARDFERPALAAVAQWLRTRSGQPLSGLTEELWARRETQRHRIGLFDDLLVKCDLPVSWGADCLRRFHEYPTRELAAAESLKNLLLKLRASNRDLALVSNGAECLQQRKCESLGLTGIFHIYVYCGPDFPERQKPSPWAWSQLAGWRDQPSTIFVGDDQVDEQFARSGNVAFVPFRFKSPKYEN
jgi:phosphoglycolate phosphatase-like HAD superfamily hydrolase